MSDFLLAGGEILDLDTGDRTRADVLIRDGQITEIGDAPEASGAERVDVSGALLSPGWMDMHVHFREPGQEHKETIETGARAAAWGGFTAVACMPNSEPPIATRDVVEFVIARQRHLPVAVHPIGTVSKGRAGEEMAEMGDMQAGGAVAFSDDGSPVQHGGLMRRALEYARTLGAPILGHEEDLTLNADHGHMNEGEVATRLGLPGIPGLAEEAMIARDALLAEFTGGHVHVCHISTARAVDIVRRAKARGVPITAEACPHHWALTDEAVDASGYDTHTKMHPPLRTAADVQAIKDGLADATIDVIATDHAPHAPFEKEVEYIAAPFGILGLETCWGLVGRDLIAPGVLPLAEAVRKLAVRPREILGLDVPRIEVGATAEITVFDADSRWTFEARHIQSKSKNTPFVGSEMVGRAWGIVNRGRWVEAHS